jgi:hypothetical protein
MNVFKSRGQAKSGKPFAQILSHANSPDLS